MAFLVLFRRPARPSATAEQARAERPDPALPLHPTVHARVPGLALATARLHYPGA